MKVEKDFKNELLGRREVEETMSHNENPGMVLAMKEVVEALKVDEKLVVIKKIGSSFGSDVFNIEAYVYDSEEMKNKVEPKKKEKKK